MQDKARFLKRVAFCIALLTLCNLASESRALGKKKKKLPPATTDMVSVPLKKVLNPAFIDDVAGKWIRFDAGFGGVLNWVIDLPPEFQKGYVRVFLSDAADGTAYTTQAVIPKEQSDPFFEAQAGKDEFEVVAYVQPLVMTMRATGAKQSSVLLVIGTVRKKQE